MLPTWLRSLARLRLTADGIDVASGSSGYCVSRLPHEEPRHDLTGSDAHRKPLHLGMLRLLSTAATISSLWRDVGPRRL